ncbi:hypothetical protein LEP1GSC058_3151 [Leptospira fainei serovar Hurstbridge str. BUT 6]|uniref:Uncharacterized protein n=1 Tax=Leptospira fainei serovar Hurstbridge str. BUT 6 TaxID=1193011 RepID=S3UVR7_9LEPT|nr:hypothetical protein [Leptospira fainei]EPG73358.1 hypothetical protein LEP1GSC058_3151 [Leptospira fainei serovar Hurstbridge str. BUT 6]
MKLKRNIRRSLYGLLLFLLVVGSLPAQKIQLPKEPTSPTEPGLDVRGESKGNPATSNPAEGPKVKGYFCDGRTIVGTWKSAPKEFAFKHKRENVVYSKTLKYDDVSRILIKSWKLLPGKPNAQGTPFRVEPWEVQYRTKGNEIFERTGDLKKEFSEIKIENELGEATLYFYWMDLQYEDKNWYSKLPKLEGDIRKECFPDVLVGLEFLTS